MSKALGNSWIVIAVSAAMLLVVAAACGATETIEVPGETVVVEKEVVKTVEVPGETVVKEVVKEVQVPGETVVVEKVVTETVEVPGETVVVEKVVTETVEVPGETVTVEVVKEVMVPGETVVVEKEVIKTVEVPVVVEKVVIQEVEVPAGPSTGPWGTLDIGFPLLGRYGTHPHEVEGHILLLNWASGAGETLVSLDGSTDFAPRLAESWSVSPDGTTWTFNLEEGVQFHRGYGEMTADDVIFSMAEHWREGSLNAFAAAIQRTWGAEGGSVSALGDYTVAVNTGTFQFDMLEVTSQANQHIFSKKQVDELGAEAASPIGALTGPWELREQGPGFYKFDAVEDHWRKTPEFAELIFWEMPEEAVRVANFQVGKLDSFTMAFDSLDTVRQVPGVKFMRVPGAAQEHIALMPQHYHKEGYDCSDPWTSCDPDVNSTEWEKARKVREALAISFDRQEIVDELLQGEGNTLVSWGWSGHQHRLPEEIRHWPFDPERAKQLLVEAGYPDGFDIDILPAIRAVPGDVEACEAMASAWEAIGINTTITRLELGPLVPSIMEGTWHGAECHGTSARLRPFSVQGISATNGFILGGSHPDLIELLAKIPAAVGEDDRWAAMVDAHRWVFENAMEFGTYDVNVLWPLSQDVDAWDEHVGYADRRQLAGFEYTPHCLQCSRP